MSKRNDKYYIYPEDRILDFTYKQFLLSHNEYEILKKNDRPTAQTLEIKTILEALPSFIDIDYKEYINLFNNPIWRENITIPCKTIVEWTEIF